MPGVADFATLSEGGRDAARCGDPDVEELILLAFYAGITTAIAGKSAQAVAEIKEVAARLMVRLPDAGAPSVARKQ